MITDPIANYLTALRNAIGARKKVVTIPASKIKTEITRVLFEQGYILSYKVVESEGKSTLMIALKYNNKRSVIEKLIRVSKPGLRKYTSMLQMPKVRSGLGLVVVSTNKGVMTDKEAIAAQVGGELLCYIY